MIYGIIFKQLWHQHNTCTAVSFSGGPVYPLSFLPEDSFVSPKKSKHQWLIACLNTPDHPFYRGTVAIWGQKPEIRVTTMTLGYGTQQRRPRAYLPIDYFEPSKLLQACAAKQGTKVFPGQTLIDVVLKDCNEADSGKGGRGQCREDSAYRRCMVCMYVYIYMYIDIYMGNIWDMYMWLYELYVYVGYVKKHDKGWPCPLNYCMF